MTRLATIFILIIFISCDAQNLNENLEIILSKKTINECIYLCDYLEIEIVNNNEVDVYLPNFLNKYLKITNDRNENILDVINDYGEISMFENLEDEYKNFIRKTKKTNNFQNILEEINFQKSIESEIEKNFFKIKSEHTNEKIEIDNLVEFVFLTKYFGTVIVPANSKVTITQDINYLFKNFIIDNGAFNYNHERYSITKKADDKYINHLKHTYENYNNMKTNKVDVYIEYNLTNHNRELEEIKIFMEYYSDSLKDTIVYPNEFPKVILDKYHFVDNLKSNKKLQIDLE